MLRLALMAILGLVLATPTLAGENVDKPGVAAAAPASIREREARGIFSSAERNLIRGGLLEAERRAAASLPPGARNKVRRVQTLPPDWQKTLVRGGHLDHAYYNRGAMLPADLLRRLPPPPPGSEILRIDDKILRLDASSRVILDVFNLGGGY